MFQRCVMIVCVVSFVLVAVGMASAVNYTFYDLGTFSGGTNSRAQGVSAANGWVGGSAYKGSNMDGFRVQVTPPAAAPALTDVTNLPSSGFYTPFLGYSINSSGEMAGYARSGSTSGPYHAVLYNGSTLTDLTSTIASQLGVTISSSGTKALGINDSELVVGQYNTSSITAGFLYDHGTVKSLGFGQESTGTNAAWAVNASGQVVGDGMTNIAIGGTSHHAYIYSGGMNGTYTDIGALLNTAFNGQPLSTDTSSYGYAISSNGKAAGGMLVSTDVVSKAWYYNGSGGVTNIGVLVSGQAAQAQGVNASGTVVGWANTGTADSYHAFTWDSTNGLKDMNTDSRFQSYLPSGWYYQRAYAINDAGWITGWISPTATSGTYHAFLLAPVPEPSTLALALGGVIGLVAYAWRKRK